METVTSFLSIDEFLQLPETQPASQLIDGQIIPKVMPQGEHSRLQYKLCSTINEVAENNRIACAFPELRCIFNDNVIVPDISVFRWKRIPKTSSGRIANRFNLYPDWSIEILSPEQSQTKVLKKLLFCSQSGTELGWLIDPDEETILIVFSEQKIRLLSGQEILPILSELDLSLTVNEVFSWLNF
ncbi:MAG: Uma2 family endonuclease [Crocosphaera sp.]|nr:Uma2 family endonuclease [Crocosphaera sp.]